MCAGKGLHRVWSSATKEPTSEKAVMHDVLVEHMLRELWCKSCSVEE